MIWRFAKPRLLRKLSRLLDLLSTPFGRTCLGVGIFVFGCFAVWVVAWILSWRPIIQLAPAVLKLVGVAPDRVQEGYLVNVLAGMVMLVVGILFRWLLRPMRLLSWARRRLLPVNTLLSRDDLQIFTRYFEATAGRIHEILPDQLREAWTQGSLTRRHRLRHGRLLRPQCRITRKDSGQATLEAISDVWDYLDSSLLDAGKRAAPLMVHGEPGSGKSVLLYHLFGERAAHLQRFRCGWIPLIVFAYELSQADFPPRVTFEQFLIAYFERLDKQYPYKGYRAVCNLVSQQYLEKQFLIILDGLDELPDRDNYFDLIGRLQVLIDQDHGRGGRPNRFIISCRTDDSPNSFQGSVIELCPLNFSQCVAYLRRASRFFSRRKTRNSQLAGHARSALAGLKASAAQSLLRNYMSNPYLLSLICEYYKEGNDSADWLRHVFDRVLEREIRKRYPDKNGGAVKLVDCLKELIGPFCFERAYTPGTLETPQRQLFEEALRKGLGVGKDLFGKRYLEAYYNRPSDGLANTRLGNLFPEDFTQDGQTFLQHLESKASKKSGAAAFEASVCELLWGWALLLLKDTGLAQVDSEGDPPQLVRFRHRRLQDYFAAACLNTSPNALEIVMPRLENAWLRDPLRIFAAVAEDPALLFEAFERRRADLENAPDKLADLLLNAGASVEYLPRRRQPDPIQQRRLQEASFRASAPALTMAADPPAAEGNKTLMDCLTAVKQAYAAECWLAPDTADLRPHDQLDALLHKNVLWFTCRPRLRRMEAYRRLWPLKHALPTLGVSRLRLFSLVMDAAPFFKDDYADVIDSTHPSGWSRAPVWLISKAQSALSIAILTIVTYWVWRCFEPVATRQYRAVALLAAVFVGLSAFAQFRAWLDFTQGYKLTLWLPASLISKLLAWRTRKREPWCRGAPRPVEAPPARHTRRLGMGFTVLACLLVVGAALYATVTWVLPWMHTSTLRREATAVAAAAERAGIRHNELLARLRAPGAERTADELDVFIESVTRHVEDLGPVLDRARQSLATGQTEESIISGLESQIAEEKDWLVALEKDKREALRLQSAREEAERTTAVWETLAKDGTPLEALGGGQKSDVEAETAVQSCQAWLKEVGDATWRHSVPSTPPPGLSAEHFNRAKTAHAEVLRIRTSVQSAIAVWEEQLAPSRERHRVAGCLERADGLVLRSQAFAAERPNLEGAEFAKVSQLASATQQWLMDYGNVMKALQEAKAGFLTPETVSSVERSKQNLAESRKEVDDFCTAVVARQNHLQSRRHLRNLEDHIAEGDRLLAETTAEGAERSAATAIERLNAWLNRADSLLYTAVGAVRTDARPLTARLDELRKSLREVQAKFKAKADDEARQATAAREALERKAALAAEASALLDGPEWKQIAADVQPFEAPLGDLATRLAAAAALPGSAAVSLETAKDAVALIDELEGKAARLDALEQAVSDFDRRLNDWALRALAAGDSSDPQLVRRAETLQKEVQDAKTGLSNFRSWMAGHPTEPLGDQLREIHRALEDQSMQSREADSQHRMAYLILAPVLVLVLVCLLLLGVPLWHLRLSQVTDDLEALGKFLERKGCPLNVSLEAANRIDAVVQERLRNSKDRRKLAAEFLEKVHKILRHSSRRHGHNADRLAMRLQQIIDGLRVELNR